MIGEIMNAFPEDIRYALRIRGEGYGKDPT